MEKLHEPIVSGPAGWDECLNGLNFASPGFEYLSDEFRSAVHPDLCRTLTMFKARHVRGPIAEAASSVLPTTKATCSRAD